jgi:SAM-dependent methyltransferase
MPAGGNRSGHFRGHMLGLARTRALRLWRAVRRRLAGPVDPTHRSSALDRLFERILRAHGLPFSSHVATPAEHERAWSEYDWSRQGYEWGYRERMLRMLSPMFAIALKPGIRVLEIGPGAGRVTELLLGEGREIVIADISRRCLDQTLERFKDYRPKLRALHIGVDDVAAVMGPASVDALVSWDCFVHIDARTTERYLALLRTILRPGAHGIIHHPDTRRAGGWRSDLDLANFVEMLVANDFLPLSHVRYVDADTHLLDHYDYVTLVRLGVEQAFTARVERAVKESRNLSGAPLR